MNDWMERTFSGGYIETKEEVNYSRNSLYGRRIREAFGRYPGEIPGEHFNWAPVLADLAAFKTDTVLLHLITVYPDMPICLVPFVAHALQSAWHQQAAQPALSGVPLRLSFGILAAAVQLHRERQNPPPPKPLAAACDRWLNDQQVRTHSDGQPSGTSS